MASNTVRTIVIFGLITLVLGGAAVGAVRLMKVRNNSYATAQAQPVAANPPQQNPQAAQKKDEPKKEETPQANKNSQGTTTPTPAPASNPPKPSTQTSPPAAAGATPNGSMPATGPTEDLFATTALLSLAVFFSVKLLKSRAEYRR